MNSHLGRSIWQNLLPERPGQTTGEEAKQAEGQHEQKEATNRRDHHVQSGRQGGHLGEQRAFRCGCHTNLLALKPGVSGCALAHTPEFNPLGLSRMKWNPQRSPPPPQSWERLWGG